MKKLIQIAWRNLWRNRKRTIITSSSIFFAVFFAIFMRSFQEGTYGYMIEQSIEAYTGYLQVQNPEYYDDPSIDNALYLDHDLFQSIKSHENIKSVAPRIESFALASTGSQSKGVLVSGIDPEAEKAITNPYHRLVRYRFTADAVRKLTKQTGFPDDLIEKIENNAGNSYSSESKIELDLNLSSADSEKFLPIIKNHTAFKSDYLSSDDQGVLVSDRLSKYLKAEIGDSIVLIGQGFHGASAAGVYPIRGIIKMASPVLDNKLVYMTVDNASIFLGIENHVTSLVMNLHDKEKMLETQEELNKEIDHSKIAIKNWEQLSPELKQQIESDEIGGIIFVGVLYFIVFFGIFGTVVMMIAERKREFGVMVALGMKRRKLASILSIEMVFIGFLGTIGGMLVSAPLLLYGHYNPLRITGETAKMYEDMGFDPVMPLALFEQYFFNQGLVILVMILLACVGPLRSINKLDVIKSIRG